jgi:para-nitrobenzyl esterase
MLKAPEPADPWEGVLDATEEGSPCAQVPLMGGVNFTGSEDCLFINIYTPKVKFLVFHENWQ